MYLDQGLWYKTGMRYKLGETPTPVGDPLTEALFIGISVFGLLVGIGFVVVGLRVKQYWMVFWGGGLALCSIAYLIYVSFFAPEMPPP